MTPKLNLMHSAHSRVHIQSLSKHTKENMELTDFNKISLIIFVVLLVFSSVKQAVEQQA